VDLLLEVCTVRSMDDPRAAAATTNLSRASDQLATAAERGSARCSSRPATSPRSFLRAENMKKRAYDPETGGVYRT
jgi:hypothetical protein